MFGSRWRLSASSVSSIILRTIFNYGIFMGIICFCVKNNGTDGRLVAHKLHRYRWFCLLMRIKLISYYVALPISFIDVLKIPHLKIIICSRLLICLICAIVTMVMQLWHEEQVLRVVNRFLRLFWRVKMLPSYHDVGFGDKWLLLVVKVFCLLYELCYKAPEVIDEHNIYFALGVLCELYNLVNAAVIYHVCFVAYLSIGLLYDKVNGYVRNELRQQLKVIANGHISRRQLKEAGIRMDECLAIYDEIHQVGNTFNRLFELPFCISLIFGLLGLALVIFFIMFNVDRAISLWFLGLKILLDILLLTLSVHGAKNSSLVVRRLSLENYYVGENKEWHMKMEMFLNRLNYHEFRVCPFGLFEVSNELILMFLSSLVTYFIYILQNGIQWEKL
ncbi:GH18712 [Drosophila grimshawi]|uniref:Gustatory receptor n=1 Tax=Drosophila grimshawi TaxID=7222 RepID=B4JGQ6_DROGR|nr:GH18712 [Drosophila grimshawi]